MKNFAQQVKDLKLKVVKIGFVCDVHFENEGRIRRVFEKLKDYPASIEITSGGNLTGGDLYVKKFCILYEIFYREYNPIYTKYNNYSVYPKYRFGKKFSKKSEFARYKSLVEESDKIILVTTDPESMDEYTSYCKKLCDKANKPYVIVN